MLMLCAHEPTMDPRVKWAAASAAARFDVTVLGFNNAAGSLPAREERDGYALLRLPHVHTPLSTYARAFAGAVPLPLWLIIAALSPLVALAAAVTLLPLAIGRALRLAGAKRRAARGEAGPAPARAPDPASLRARVSYVANLMRMQFGPGARAFIDHIEAMPAKPLVIHCNDLDTLLAGVVARRRHGCRVVYDAHEYYPYCDPYGRWLDIWILSAIEWLLVRQADGLVTITAPMARQMGAAYGVGPFHAVPNAEPRATRPVAPLRTAMGDLAGGRLRCLVQGRYSPKRGLEELIEGWRHVDPGKAALFLRGPENEHSRRARELAAGLGLLDRSVYFLEAVTEDELVAAAAEADVGVIPYLSDFVIYEYACPNKLAQYMHAGLAVLSNDLAYVRSVVERGGAGLIYRAAEEGSLAAAVHRLADDRAQLSRLGAAAADFARDTFNWQAYSPIFDALYLGQSPRLAPDGTARPPAPSAGPASMRQQI